MERNGTHCKLCGYEIFSWQEEEYDVLPGMCAECSLEINDFTGGDYDESLELAELLF